VTLDQSLALADACASAISGVCAVLAFAAIRKRAIKRHRNLMLGAVVASAAFLALFVIRFVSFGFAKFEGGDALRVFYYVVLFSHEPLAVVSVPLVLVAMILGLSKSYRAHREIAQVALPIWLYSAATGVVLYVLLYVI
jgi:putative membrane protein